MVGDDSEARRLLASVQMSAVDEFAAATKEMFDGLVRQGFTEEQAIAYCSKFAVEAQRGDV
jgi:hypothetical protein